MSWFQAALNDGHAAMPLRLRVEAAKQAILETVEDNGLAEAFERAMPQEKEKVDACPCEEGNSLALEDLENGDVIVIMFKKGPRPDLMIEEAVPEECPHKSAAAAMAPSTKMLRLAAAANGRKVVRERRYRAGYVIRDEIWVDPQGREMLMERQAYTPNGDWIGDSVWAYRLMAVKGITPEKADPSHSVCSIGYCAKERKWYGWSHRAMCGFKIGDKMYVPDWPEATEKTPCHRHGDETIGSLEQAKEAAKAFAREVS